MLHLRISKLRKEYMFPRGHKIESINFYAFVFLSDTLDLALYILEFEGPQNSKSRFIKLYVVS